jgi:hypothetical protein
MEGVGWPNFSSGMAPGTWSKYGGIAIDFIGLGALLLRPHEPPSQNMGLVDLNEAIIDRRAACYYSLADVSARTASGHHCVNKMIGPGWGPMPLNLLSR